MGSQRKGTVEIKVLLMRENKRSYFKAEFSQVSKQDAFKGRSLCDIGTGDGAKSMCTIRYALSVHVQYSTSFKHVYIGEALRKRVLAGLECR